MTALQVGIAALVLTGAICCNSGEREPELATDSPTRLLADAVDRFARSGDVEGEIANWARHDIGFRPESPVESIELMALLSDTDGQPLSFWYRIDRLTLPSTRGPKSVPAQAGEDFRAAALIRSSGLQASAKAVERRDFVERATLGLASFDDSSLQVRDVELTLANGRDPASSCGGTYQLRDGLGLSLRFTRDLCATTLRAGDYRIATVPLPEVQGEVHLDGRTRTVTGRGWARQLRGIRPPLAGGAVVFDRLLLTLDGVGQIDVLRSRRASGSGPVQATAAFDDSRGVGAADAAIEWLDADDGDSAAWRLVEPTRDIDIVLTPVIAPGPAHDLRARTSGGSGSPGSSLRGPALTGSASPDSTWHGAVRARGSHSGIGFVEISLPDVVLAKGLE